MGCEDVETGNRHQAEECLSKQQLLSDCCHRISRGEERDEFRVGIVKSGAVGKKAISHEVQSTTVVVLSFGLIQGYTTSKLVNRISKTNRRHDCDPIYFIVYLLFSMDWQIVSPRATSTALVVHLVISGLFSKSLMYLVNRIDILIVG